MDGLAANRKVIGRSIESVEPARRRPLTGCCARRAAPWSTTVTTLRRLMAAMYADPSASSSSRSIESFGGVLSIVSIGLSYVSALNSYLCNLRHDAPRDRRLRHRHGRPGQHEGVSRMRLPAVKVPALRGAFRERDPFRIGIVATAVTVLLGVLVTVLSTVQLGNVGATPPSWSTPAGCGSGSPSQVAGVDSGQGHRHPAGGEEGDRRLHRRQRHPASGRDTRADGQGGHPARHPLPRRRPDRSGRAARRPGPAGADRRCRSTCRTSSTRAPAAADELDSELLGQALGEMADTLRAAGPEFLPALQGIDRLSRVVAERVRTSSSRCCSSSRGVADQLSASSDDLLSLMRQTNLVVAELTARRSPDPPDAAQRREPVPDRRRRSSRDTRADVWAGPGQPRDACWSCCAPRTRRSAARCTRWRSARATWPTPPATDRGSSCSCPARTTAPYCAEGGSGCQ